MAHITILGIDPGTREMGTAVIRGPKLLAAGVHTLRNGSRPYDTVGHARRIVLEQIKDFAPQLVAIEKPLLLPTKRAALVSVIGQELHERGTELGCQVVEMDAREVRKALAGDAKLNKLQVARLLVDRHFPQLASKVPRPPARAALGFAAKDRYWLHMFDALAVAVAASTARR
jgi:Holliday junction resolvasome RuvABC endonuclease subunit